MPETSHGWGLNPTTAESIFYPRENRVNRRISIYLSTRAGNLPSDRTSAQAGLDTNRSSGPFRSEITERVLSPDLAGSDSIYRVFKTQLIFRNARWHFNGGKNDVTNGVHLNKHIYLNGTRRQWCSHAGMQNMYTAMQPNKQCTGREQRHEQGESTTTD